MKKKTGVQTIHDVSLALDEKTIIYPGNPKVHIKKKKTKTSYISELKLGSHSGTHIDAPRHATKSGKGIDALPLDRFLGPCRVIEVTDADLYIGISHLKEAGIKRGDRILVKTKNSRKGYKTFRKDYIYLEPHAATFLANVGIKLLGIDYLSVKKQGSEDNRTHTALLKKNIPIIEGLNLARVTPGEYFLVALPLKLTGGDAAPARVALINL